MNPKAVKVFRNDAVEAHTPVPEAFDNIPCFEVPSELAQLFRGGLLTMVLQPFEEHPAGQLGFGVAEKKLGNVSFHQFLPFMSSKGL